MSDAAWIIIVGAVANVSWPLLGCYLVLRRMSLLGDAISHAVLPGIAIAFLLTGQINGLPIFVGAMAIGVLTTFLTQTLHSVGRVPEDASMGVAYTSLFALGVLMIARWASHVDLDPGCVLYGLIEFVPWDTVPRFGLEVPRALTTLGAALALTVFFVLLFWKELKIVSFDPALATAMGINALVVHYLLMAMVAGVTVASFEAVGSILVIAMLIVPGAAAHLLTDRLGWMMVWSVVVAVVSAVLGYTWAARLNTSVAGMMAVVAGLQFMLIVFLAPRHGLVSKVLRNLALSLRIAGEDVLAMLYRLEESGAGQGATHSAALRETKGLSGALIGRLALLRLWWQDRIRFAGDGQIGLNQKGRNKAKSLIRSHRLWEKYLAEQFVLPLDHLHEPAERMEHFIGPQLQSELATDLHEPAVDPHGRSIPREGSLPVPADTKL